jgi:site-specific DNA-methyltransferase (adenine-specific)
MSGLRNRILVGDIRERLADVPARSIDCVITSPPYFQLRDYGVQGQLGLEQSVEGWVDELKLALRGLVRVLKPSGSLWLNLGDTYSRHTKYGAAPKGLLLAPERLLLALTNDGWIVRNKVIWAKTNPMPHAVGDRLSNAYDVVYFLVRSRSYYFDLDAIRVEHRSSTKQRYGRPWPPEGAGAPSWNAKGPNNRGLSALKARGLVGHLLGKNPGDVWQLPGANFPGAHFATFPPVLVERPLLATCPELICQACGTAFRRITRVLNEHERRPDRGRVSRGPRVLRYDRRYSITRQRGPLLPDCTCGAAARPGIVLDPFFGAGTVAVVAERHGRDWLGIELNPEYAAIARERIKAARWKRADDNHVSKEVT